MHLKKILNWEYWPSSLFYIPNLPYAFFLCVKAKSPVFFSIANPGIKHSGNGSESKFETLLLIPKEYRPKSILKDISESADSISSQLEKEQIQFPVIIKPDVGFRGLLVKKIYSQKELEHFLNQYKNIKFIIQEYIDYELECGIFYHRIPTHSKGMITSITLKKYLHVVGDGHKTVDELIKNDPRAKIYYAYLKEITQIPFSKILKKDETLVLSTIGNHSKGSQFINANHLISTELTNAIDLLIKKIPRFYYGRLDVKFKNFDDLETLQNFKVLELNGIISEPTHIYDATKGSYFGALKEIRNHWKKLYQIAITNHKVSKIPYENTASFVKSLKKIRKQVRQIKGLSH